MDVLILGEKRRGEILPLALLESFPDKFALGISAAGKEKLFTAYAQVDAQSSSKVASGTGLGLAISKRLVSAMLGEVVVQSELVRHPSPCPFRPPVSLPFSLSPLLSSLALPSSLLLFPSPSPFP